MIGAETRVMHIAGPPFWHCRTAGRPRVPPDQSALCAPRAACVPTPDARPHHRHSSIIACDSIPAAVLIVAIEQAAAALPAFVSKAPPPGRNRTRCRRVGAPGADSSLRSGYRNANLSNNNAPPKARRRRAAHYQPEAPAPTGMAGPSLLGSHALH
jgi:hypothetical protein